MATIGSLGDLHPILALGAELKRRGHWVTVTTTGHYKDKVEGLGLGFHSLGPNWDPTDHDLIAECENLKTGTEVLLRKLVLPHLRETYDDLLAACLGADLLVAGELVYGAPLVSEKLGLRWVSEILSPCSFFSAYDPSLFVNIPNVYKLRKAGWFINRAVLDIGKLMTWHWWGPVRQLRREEGLRVQCSPVFKDKFSRDLVLALFSPCLAQQQPDWPKSTLQPGFIFYDRQKPKADENPGLTAFLAAGEAPIVFTLGSTAVYNPGNFYEASMEAVRQLGRRAILIGVKPDGLASSEQVLMLPYAPYSEIFPRAAVIVHQGGSGTTGQAMLAGRPQLFVPYGWDQPDNAVRIERQGAGLSVARSEYSAETAAAALKQLLEDARFAARAAEIGTRMAKEDALVASCDAIEAIL